MKPELKEYTKEEIDSIRSHVYHPLELNHTRKNKYFESDKWQMQKEIDFCKISGRKISDWIICDKDNYYDLQSFINIEYKLYDVYRDGDSVYYMIDFRDNEESPE